MSVNSVGGLGYYYGAYNPNGGKNIDPRKDPVYIDHRTGQKTTWKPGVYDPKAIERSQRRRKFFGFALLATLAFVFRKKIFKGIDFLKALIKK